MSPEEVEARVIELKHAEPFVPYVVELKSGESLEITYPGLAINGGGAGFFGPDGGLVDFEFKDVKAIRLLDAGALA